MESFKANTGRQEECSCNWDCIRVFVCNFINSVHFKLFYNRMNLQLVIVNSFVYMKVGMKKPGISCFKEESLCPEECR